MNEIKDKIAKCIVEVKPEIKENLAKNFIEEALLDSLDLMNLIIALEEEFDIAIDPEDVITDNFETLDTIAALVSKCQA